MKRRALFILLLLVAGAIVNVAVAWGFALLSETEPGKTTELALAGPRVSELRTSHTLLTHGHARLTSVEREDVGGVGVSWTYTKYLVEVPPGDALLIPLVIDIALDCGWPSKSLQNTAVYDIVERREGDVRYVWPIRPAWPGFAINTVFYAGVLWLLFAAPFALRRRRRIKRGLCPKCAYPVGTNEVCTECGAAVVQKAVS